MSAAVKRTHKKPTLNQHIDSLATQLHYFLTRIRDHPTDAMVAMVEANIRERLENMRRG